MDWMKNNLIVKLKRVLVVAVVVALALGCFASCGTGASDSWAGFSKDSYYFDTICRITIYGLDDSLIGDGLSEKEFDQTCTDIISRAFKELAGYEQLLSRTVSGSDVDWINHASGEAVEVSPDTLAVIIKGLEFGDLSGGDFDITIGGVTSLWDFHMALDPAVEAHLPDDAALAEALKHVDYAAVQIDVDSCTVRLADPDAVLDLGGIAKGYIADRITEFLVSQGVTDAIVNLGGNIEALGGKPKDHLKPRGDDPDASGTVRLGINDPRDESGKLLTTFDARDVTVVTSGTYERYIEVDGVKYHHILDPETGYPVENSLTQVTIVAGRGHSVDCDGLSTVCLALGLDSGVELINELAESDNYGPLWAIFVTDSGEVLEAGNKAAFAE